MQCGLSAVCLFDADRRPASLLHHGYVGVSCGASCVQGCVEVYQGPERSFKVLKLIPGARYNFWVMVSQHDAFLLPCPTRLKICEHATSDLDPRALRSAVRKAGVSRLDATVVTTECGSCVWCRRAMR